MNRPQRMAQIMREEYEDHCQHPKVMLVVPPTTIDAEGGTIGLRCTQCGEVVSEGVVYE